MNVHGQHYRTIWLKEDDPAVVQIIDQRQLPFHFVVEDLTTVEAVAAAIQEMHVRGAGLIGATAGYGMMLAAFHAPRTSLLAFRAAVEADALQLKATRPTAVNLAWAVDRQLAAMRCGGRRHRSADRGSRRYSAYHRRRRRRFLPAHRRAWRGADRGNCQAQGGRTR